MLWQVMKPTMISGNSSRPSLFGSSVQQSQGFHARMGDMANPTPSDWYDRAKVALAKYDDLNQRTLRIADQANRKVIQDWMGSPYSDGTPANRAQSVLTDIREDVESFVPANVNAYQVPTRTKRIEDLEGINRNLEPMVVNAEAIHGTLPSNQIATQQPPQEAPGWLLPIVVGVAALGIATIVTAVYGGKN